MSRRKPRVGIIASGPHKISNQSQLLAQYLGGLLVLGEYSNVRIAYLDSETSCKTPSKDATKSITLMPASCRGSPQTVPVGTDFELYAELSSLKDCDMIINVANASDSGQCAHVLKQVLSDRSEREMPIGLFSLQHGARSFETISSNLKGQDHLLLLDSTIGFHVVEGKVDGVLRPLLPGSIIMERLSKEKAEHGLKFDNLIATMDIPILYRKVLTPFTWGTMIFDCCFSLNALSGESLEDHLKDRHARLIYAQMIRECLQAFKAAAQLGPWAPDGSASCPVSLSILEVLLCLPTLLFVPIFRCLFPAASSAGSSVQVSSSVQGRYSSRLVVSSGVGRGGGSKVGGTFFRWTCRRGVRPTVSGPSSSYAR